MEINSILSILQTSPVDYVAQSLQLLQTINNVESGTSEGSSSSLTVADAIEQVFKQGASESLSNQSLTLVNPFESVPQDADAKTAAAAILNPSNPGEALIGLLSTSKLLEFAAYLEPAANLDSDQDNRDFWDEDILDNPYKINVYRYPPEVFSVSLGFDFDKITQLDTFKSPVDASDAKDASFDVEFKVNVFTGSAAPSLVA